MLFTLIVTYQFLVYVFWSFIQNFNNITQYVFIEKYDFKFKQSHSSVKTERLINTTVDAMYEICILM